ncbi:SLC13 family permease [Planococcus dechangensis]|uniref:SLC13 family permease n=1 Tax=Planococcus dechangensis TaxID=1176255 RepID=A0ABV9ME68_9BACL
MRNSKLVPRVLALLLAGGFALLWAFGWMDAYTTDQKLTLLLLGIAISLWTVSVMPLAASSLLVLGLLLLFRLTEEPEQAFAGFLSDALYFILALTLVSKVLVKAGADQVFVGILLKVSKGKVQRLLIGLPLLITFLPILLPSAVARFRILEPIIEQVNDRFELGERSVFRQFSLYVIGMMNQNSTMIVFTGGGFPILAAQLLRDFGGVQISWLGWFLRIAPPLWIALAIISFGVWFFFKRKNGEVRRMEQMEFTPATRLPERFWWVIVPFIAMIISWIVIDQEQIPLIVAPFLLLAYYALPVNGLVDDQLVREYDWETFLLLGASFSLGYLIEENGTAGVLASQLIQLLPEGMGDAGNIIFVAMIIFLLRFLFVVPSTSMIVIFPIIMSFAGQLELSVLAMAFLLIMIVGGVTILPIHSPTTFLAFQKGAFTQKEQLLIGTYSSVVLTCIASVFAIFIW